MPPRLFVTWACVCAKECVCTVYFTHKEGFSLCVSFRAAQSVQSRHLHRACVHSATSGCVTSAQMCISIREPLPLPSTQTCTINRGPVPPSVLTCTREAPAPCLRLDKARYFHISKLWYLHFPGQYDRLLVVYTVCLSICHLKACFGLFVFPLVLCLFVNHVSVGVIAMNNAWQWRWLIIVPGDLCVLLHLSLTNGPDSEMLV